MELQPADTDAQDSFSGGHTLPPCMDDLEPWLREHPGIVCVTIPTRGMLDIVYKPEIISRREVREFAEHAGRAVDDHTARCTMPLHGHACEACAVLLQDRLVEIPGVRHATASFLNGSLSVIFDRSKLSPADLVGQAKHAGVPLLTSAEFLDGWRKALHALDSTRGQTILVSIAGVALVTGFALGFISTVSPLITMLCYVVAYLAGGYSGVRASISSLKMRVLDVDVLMVLAAIGAALIDAPAEGALLLFLFALSNLLQDQAVGKARRAIAALVDLRPTTAMVKQGSELVEVSVDAVEPGTIIVLRPGDRVPLDGTVVAGSGSIDQAPVTGESMPVEKNSGDEVFTGTLNQEGSLEILVSKSASESTLARMISLVEAAQSEKATTQKFLETAEQYYAGGVVAITALLATVPPLVADVSFAPAFYRSMAFMVVASPCALILSTPAAILSAIAGLGRRGILVKGGRHLEDGATITAVAFDKTGTLTIGRPTVTAILPVGEGDLTALQNELLFLTAQAEGRSEHPLARAVINEAETRGLPVQPPVDFSSITGRGGEALLADGSRITFGSLKLMQECACTGYKRLAELAGGLEQDGQTVICVARETPGSSLEALGVLGLQDVLRPDAADTVKALRAMGIERIVMLSGDSENVARAVAAKAGIDEVYGALMPEDKVKMIHEIAAKTPVMMVGDGINDAPALAAANLGVAMGAAGTDVAMETADVVLMSHNLQQVAAFLKISRKARRVITQNLVFAAGVVAVLLVAALGFNLPLSLGVLGHEGSTVLVCLNGLRLLRPVRS